MTRWLYVSNHILSQTEVPLAGSEVDHKTTVLETFVITNVTFRKTVFILWAGLFNFERNHKGRTI